MKKLLLVLGMITCMFGLTACGGTVEEVDNYGVTEADAYAYADGLIETIDLCDSRYGKTIEKATYNKLIDVVHQNKDLAQTEASLRKNLICYEIAERCM